MKKQRQLTQNLKKYWEEYLSSDVMERYVLNANSPFKYTLSTEEFTYVEPENYRGIIFYLSRYYCLKKQKISKKIMVPSNLLFFPPFYNRCVCAGIKFLRDVGKMSFSL